MDWQFLKRAPRLIMTGLLLVAFIATAGLAQADDAKYLEAAKKWIAEEFQPSTLSKEEQLKEMEWFIQASKPFRGMEIKVVSETIPTHEYESKVLTKAFEEITGIKVTHDLIQEGDVIEKLQVQMQSGQNDQNPQQGGVCCDLSRSTLRRIHQQIVQNGRNRADQRVEWQAWKRFMAPEPLLGGQRQMHKTDATGHPPLSHPVVRPIHRRIAQVGARVVGDGRWQVELSQQFLPMSQR